LPKPLIYQHIIVGNGGLWCSGYRRGFGRVSGGACVGGVGTADGHWGGALDGNVDAGGRPWPWGGLGLSRGGVGERAAVQERVLRLEREKAMWRSF